MAQNPDPFDVQALEKSLNDSAARVSTIWISFLIFGLYLVVAASAVTHRQLLLEDPIKLPALNVDLPLIGFFFLTPILFVAFHVYVLIQVLLLARTAAAYNRVLDRTVTAPSDNAEIRQRLTNTLFAQIFAGSPHERGGWLGGLLRIIAWLTLAIAPVLVLLVFQFKFLPYHSHLITWSVRLLILFDLIAVLVLWRAAHRPDGISSWRFIFHGRIAWICAIVLAGFSWVVLSFPGEPHAGWSRFSSQEEPLFQGVPECWTESPLSVAFPDFDRLSLQDVDVVDTEKLAKMQKGRRERIVAPRKHTRSLNNRDLNCADLSTADLRGVNLSGAKLRGSDLYWADLEGADLSNADLTGAGLYATTLGDSRLRDADLRGASLESAELPRAELMGAQLQGASLRGAHLHGTNLIRAQAQGADLSNAQLEGAVLSDTELQGASLNGAYLQFALLRNVQLQGADLTGADLGGAHLEMVGLQGANLHESAMQYTILSATYVWRAKNVACANASVDGRKSEAHLPVIENKPFLPLVRETVPAASDYIAKFIEKSVARISDPKRKNATIERMQSALVADPAQDDTAAIEEVWRKCGESSQQISAADFQKQGDAFVRNLFCDTKRRVCARDFYCDVNRSVNAVANAIIGPSIGNRARGRSLSRELARGMLGEDGEPCAASVALDEENKARLREVIATPNRN